MSEEALSKHINELIDRSKDAPIPENPELQEFTGTVQLAHSALTSPTPSADVETASRDRLLSYMKHDVLSPRELQDVTGSPASPGSRFWQSLRRIFNRS